MILRYSPHGGGQHIPRGVLVHSMGEYLKVDGKPMSAAAFLESQKLSAHVLAPPRGELIRCRDDHQIAWHAKKPASGPYAGQFFNTGFLGIEFLVPGVHTYDTFVAAIKEPYVNDDQFVLGVNQIIEWCRLYRIPRARVLRHSDIDPDRKPDPGAGFPWDALHSELRRAGVN